MFEIRFSKAMNNIKGLLKTFKDNIKKSIFFAYIVTFVKTVLKKIFKKNHTFSKDGKNY
jgi:hypothetical protein